MQQILSDTTDPDGPSIFGRVCWCQCAPVPRPESLIVFGFSWFENTPKIEQFAPKSRQGPKKEGSSSKHHFSGASC